MLEKNRYYDYFMDLSGDEGEIPLPGMFEVLGKAIDISIAAEKTSLRADNFDCDLLIKPDLPFVPAWKRILYLDFMDLSDSKRIYEQGRAAANRHLPKIRHLMSQKIKAAEEYAE